MLRKDPETMHITGASADPEGSAAMLVAVATDGHRLALAHIPAPSGSLDMPGIIVPRKTVAEILRLTGEDDKRSLHIAVSLTKIRFRLGDLVLTSKLIDGTFPDYTRVIPAGNDKHLVVEREPFIAAIERVSTVASERGRAVKLTLSQGRLELAVNNPDQGSASEEMDVDYTDTAITIGFNARYLLDNANHMEGETALIKLSDPASPTILVDREGADTLFVLMPMRV